MATFCSRSCLAGDLGNMLLSAMSVFKSQRLKIPENGKCLKWSEQCGRMLPFKVRLTTSPGGLARELGGVSFGGSVHGRKLLLSPGFSPFRSISVVILSLRCKRKATGGHFRDRDGGSKAPWGIKEAH